MPWGVLWRNKGLGRRQIGGEKGGGGSAPSQSLSCCFFETKFEAVRVEFITWDCCPWAPRQCPEVAKYSPSALR